MCTYIHSDEARDIAKQTQEGKDWGAFQTQRFKVSAGKC